MKTIHEWLLYLHLLQLTVNDYCLIPLSRTQKAVEICHRFRCHLRWKNWNTLHTNWWGSTSTCGSYMWAIVGASMDIHILPGVASWNGWHTVQWGLFNVWFYVKAQCLVLFCGKTFSSDLKCKIFYVQTVLFLLRCIHKTFLNN